MRGVSGRGQVELGRSTPFEERSTAERHEYQLFLALSDIDHIRTKAKSPQTNGISECFHKTILEESCQVALRKKIYTSLEELQQDLDVWLDHRPHQGKRCDGKTPMATFIEALELDRSKSLNTI